MTIASTSNSPTNVTTNIPTNATSTDTTTASGSRTPTPTTTQPQPPTLDAAHLARAREVRRDFLVAIEEHRPALFAYCRRLATNVWDAEDLVQETLAKAFARAAETHVEIANPAGWLIRIATNTYIDQTRRAQAVPMGDRDVAAAPTADPGEVRDALKELVTVLPPQERAVLVLKDVFDYPLADIASMVGTTTGAVKSALHRGRTKLSETAPPSRATRPAPDRAVLAAAADAFTSYDMDRLVALFLDDGVMHIVGMVHETGGQQMREGSFEHTFDARARRPLPRRGARLRRRATRRDLLADARRSRAQRALRGLALYDDRRPAGRVCPTTSSHPRWSPRWPRRGRRPDGLHGYRYR